MTHLLCLGDSITDCGRLFDTPPLGSGYVYLLSQKLKEHEMDWHITNCGVDGFTTARLLANAESFYLPLAADLITILVGINDIGLMMNTSRTPEQQRAMMTKTLQNYRQLLQCLTRADCPAVLMEPFIFPCPQQYRNWIPLVRTLSQGIQTLSEEFHCPYIQLHDYLNQEAYRLGMEALTPDGIHLTPDGHEILADKLFQQLAAMKQDVPACIVSNVLDSLLV